MIQNIITAMIPALLRQVAEIPDDDKRTFADFLAQLCVAYREADYEEFSLLLSLTNFPPEWKKALVTALWNKESIR